MIYKIGTNIHSKFNLFNYYFVTYIVGVPYDGVPVVEVITTHVGLSVIYIIICTGGIIFAVICFIFNFMFRTKK